MKACISGLTRFVFQPKLYTRLPLQQWRQCSTAQLPQLGPEEELITNYLRQNRPFSESSLENLKDQVIASGKKINQVNFDSIFLEMCRMNGAVSQGKDFFYSLLPRGPNIGSIGRFCRLMYDNRESCTEEDKNLIVSLYQDMKEKYPSFDVRNCESFAFGLSLTDAWEEGLKLLEMAKESGVPTPKNYSVVSEAAFLNGKPEKGWSVLEELLKSGRKPTINLLKSYFMKYGTKEDLKQLLERMVNYDFQPTSILADLIGEHYDKVSETKSAITTVSPRGVCKNCQKSLEEVSVSDEEFSRLREAFLRPVLIGRDVYLKTDPTELKTYLNFIRRVGKVDVVLDGLNIAYAAGTNKGPVVFSKMLRDVVNYFVKVDMKVMILGRKHMLKWPEINMSFVERYALVFYAENISQDDPMLLYAAMSSGLGTIFVSRDQMRGHKYLLKDLELIKIFSKWQQKYQYSLKYVDKKGKVSFHEPLVYLQDSQMSPEGNFHLPLTSSDEHGIHPEFKHLHTKWLCLPRL